MRTATVWVRNDQELSNDADGERQQGANELGVYLRATCNADDLEESVDVNAQLEVQLANGTTQVLPRHELYICNKEVPGGVEDMTSLTYMEEPNLLHNLRLRFQSKNIYTNIARVLAAVNPYERLNIYSEETMAIYRHSNFRNQPPHTFKVAEECYRSISTYGANQSLIVSGESGAGKTESAKQLMRYLARRSCGSGNASPQRSKNVEQQVLETNPILESFGNAKTVLNNNSSRFGKFTKIFMSGRPLVSLNADDTPERRRDTAEVQMRIEGASTETYLLEKSRVVSQANAERNYHIFYQLCTKANPDNERLGLQDGAESFHYLNQGNAFSVQGINDEDDFEELCHALDTVSVNAGDRNAMFEMIASILHIGNLSFEALNGDEERMAVSAASRERLATIARLLSVDVDLIESRLCSQSMTVRREVLVQHFDASAVEYNRDAFAKELYAGLFEWVLKRMNSALKYSSSLEATPLSWVGILDVFGFECFVFNSLEQFCINFANERLQQHFNSHVLLSEQEEYIREAIFWSPVDVVNNQDAITLIDDKKIGILTLLTTACIMPQPTDEKFTGLLFDNHPSHPRLKRVTKQAVQASDASTGPRSPNRAAVKKGKGRQFERINGFSFRHYAGEVVYNASGFLKKNTDKAHNDTIVFLRKCGNAVAQSLLPTDDDEATPSDSRRRAGRAKKKNKTLGALFQKQLRDLMETLEQTNPHFVRCIKPNRVKKAGFIDLHYVRPQIRCGGLVEAVRMLKHGFPTRAAYEDIAERFVDIAQLQGRDFNARDLCEAVLLAFGLERSAYQLGLTKAFFRSGKQALVDKILADSEDPSLMDPEIPGRIRAMLRRKKLLRTLAVVKVSVRFSTMLRRSRAVLGFRRIVRISVLVIKAFVRRSKTVRIKGAITAIQAAFKTIALKQSYKNTFASGLIIIKFWRHNRSRRQLQLELLKRSYKKQKNRQIQQQRTRDIEGMSTAEVVAYDKRNDVLLRVLQWFDKIMEEPKPHSKTELDPLTFWSSLPDGVMLAKALSSVFPAQKHKVHFSAKAGSFFARDNIDTFLRATEQLGIDPDLLTGADTFVHPEKNQPAILRVLAEFVRLCHEKHGAPSAGVSAVDVIEVVEKVDKEEIVEKEMLEDSTEKKLGSISGSEPSRDTIDESVSHYADSGGIVSPRRTSETKPSTAATFTVASHSRVLSKVPLELNEIVADENDERSQEELLVNTELMSLDEEFGSSAEKVDLSSVQPPEELQKQISQLYSLALRNNRFNLIRMFAGFNNDSENSMFTAFDNHDDPQNAEQLEQTSSNEEQSVALESMAEPSSVLTRPETTLGISDTYHSTQSSDKDDLDGVVPIVDVQLVLAERGEKLSAPAGYRILSTTYAGRSANLKKGSKGRSAFLCYKRASPNSHGQWKRVNGRLVVEKERPITALAVIHREFNEATPYGFERIDRTPNGLDANLNHGTKGAPIYLCVKRGNGPPITAINLFVAKKNDPFPPGYRWVIQTPDRHVANLNRGSGNRIIFLLYRIDIPFTLLPFRRLGFKRVRDINMSASQRAQEVYYSRVFACSIAAMYSTNEALVSTALDVIGVTIRSTFPLPLTPLRVLVEGLSDLMPSFSSCFRKTSRVELESSVLLIFRDVFVAYVDLLPIQTLANIFSCTLSFRPDMSRATLIRQMFQAVLDNKVLQGIIKSRSASQANLKGVPQDAGDVCASIVKELGGDVAFASSTDSDVNVICAESDLGGSNFLFVHSALTKAINRKEERLVLSLLIVITKYCEHDPDPEHVTPIDASVIDNLGIERRIHAMELLLHVLETSMEWIRSNSACKVLLKRFLTSCLLRCCIEGIQHRLFFQRVLQIIVFLWRSFREEMKNELSFILDTILLGILKSENCTSRQKQDILEALAVVFHSSQDLVDVFYNFDNDSSIGLNLFEDLVTVTSKISDGVLPSSDEDYDPRAEIALRRRALENAVTIFSLMLERVGTNSLPQETSPDQAFLPHGRSTSVWELRFSGVKTAKESMESALLQGKMGNLIDGLQIIVDAGMREHNSVPVQSIVSFLVENSQLFDREDVGRFLCSTGVYNSLEPLNKGHHAAILAAYFASIDFTALDLVDALRDLFNGNLGIYIPYELEDASHLTVQEEMIILEEGRSRLLHEFSKAYCRDNCNVFPNTYACKRVATALVKLNEEVHYEQKPHNKMSWLQRLYPLFSSDDRSDSRNKFQIWLLESYFDSVVFARLDDEHHSLAIHQQHPQQQHPQQQGLSPPKEAPNLPSSPAAMLELRIEVFDLVRKVRGQIHRQRFNKSPLEASDSWRIVSAMFEVAWPRFIASLSTIIDNATRRDIIFLCLDGLLNGALLALRLGFKSQLQHFTEVIALMRYTFKFESEHVTDLTSKTAENLKDDTDRGRYLDQQWLKDIQQNSFDEIDNSSDLLISIVEETKMSVRLKLNCDKLREVCSSWAPDFRLVHPAREFVGQGQLSKVNSTGKVQPYLFILFNDALLYGDMNVCHQVIHLSVLHVVDVPDDESEDAASRSSQTRTKDRRTQFAFKVRSPRKEILVLASSAAQKNLWLNTIIRTMVNYRTSHRKDWFDRVQDNGPFEDDAPADACRLCLKPFSSIRRRRGTCPMCKHSVCPECINVRLQLPNSKKKKTKVCDSCVVNTEETRGGIDSMTRILAAQEVDAAGGLSPQPDTGAAA